MSAQDCLTATSTRTMGAASESDGIGILGTLAQGRTGQSGEKNRVLLAFAKRVADGLAKPHETAFMTALMAADIPENASTADGQSPAVPISGSDDPARGGE